jgi:hypothetical protein
MARNEHENLNGLIVPETDQLEVHYIDKTGEFGLEQTAVAKITKLHNKEEDRIIVNYYVKHGRGMLFDPYGMDMNKLNAYNFQFKKVDNSVYSKYVQYLKTRRQLFLTHAQREFINKGS